MTVTVTVKPEPRTKPGMMASLVNPAWSAGTEAVTGFYAEVEIDGATFQVSQMPGETEWTVDAAFAPGSSCPAFMNGFGARYMRTKVLRAEHAAVVEAAKPPTSARCFAHDLPGGHTCTDLCTTDCSCKAVSV
jgi:hypothetical protein